jgi:hypothetical protein
LPWNSSGGFKAATQTRQNSKDNVTSTFPEFWRPAILASAAEMDSRDGVILWVAPLMKVFRLPLFHLACCIRLYDALHSLGAIPDVTKIQVLMYHDANSIFHPEFVVPKPNITPGIILVWQEAVDIIQKILLIRPFAHWYLTLLDDH